MQRWKLDYLRGREGDPLEERKARVTVNSILRCAKSLFSERVLRFVELELPDPLPFEGVEFERVKAPRYRSEIDPKELTQAAFEELGDLEPEQLKIFLLALGVGLRRKEIDTLTWQQLDLERSIIRIETNEHASLKSD